MKKWMIMQTIGIDNIIPFIIRNDITISYIDIVNGNHEIFKVIYEKRGD